MRDFSPFYIIPMLFSPEIWEKYTSSFGVDKCRQISKNVYLWHDTNTKKLYNKWFLIRVKPIDNKEEK